MPDDVEAFGIFIRHDAQCGVAVDQRRGIHQFAVELAGKRGFRKAGPDAGGNVRNRYRVIKLLLATVWKGNQGHMDILLKGLHPSIEGMVRASGIEPLTPTMSR